MIIKEGLTKLYLPKDYTRKKTFFNPKMELTRDLTILVLKNIDVTDWIVCDLLAATGARGVRIAKEADVKEVWINDANPDIIKIIKHNTKINNLNNVKIFNEDGNVLLSRKQKFDYIDIDPFGSPVYFFDSIVGSIKKGGLIGMSATDTGCLSGSFPSTCLERYGILNFKTDFSHEVGVRILITSLRNSLCKKDLDFIPLISYHKQHYYRVWGMVKEMNRSSKKKIGAVSYCQKCLWREVDTASTTVCGFCGSTCKILDGIWIGEIEDQFFIEKCLNKLPSLEWLNTRTEIRNLLDKLKNETVPFYYDIHKLCKAHKLKIPRFELLMKRIDDRGFKFKRTHFSNIGVKTDARLKDMVEIIKGIG